MITGVWISPDRNQVAVQFDYDEINILDTEHADPMPADVIPADWDTLHTAEEL